ncbi:MAG: hypothetical protein ACFFFB_19325 [Candidatus Heimdallarchaeota archaeon]
MPIGFCCENCFLYDEFTICLKSKSKNKETVEIGDLKLINASIEGQLLKVVISHQEKEEKTLFIDLKKYLES